MSLHRPTLVWPGPGRVTLALLAVVPAAMAYPWRSTRDLWVLGIAATVVIILFGWWRGLHLTTILRRRLAMLRPQRPVREFSAEARTTALLRIGRPAGDTDVLPLPLLARYLNCYGIRADTIRVTSCDIASDIPQRATWIGLTVSAADNLAALQARSPRIPLHETAQVAVRRLADHLRELGWESSTAGPDDIPPLFEPSARETWQGVQEDDANYVAAYRVSADDALPHTLAAIWSYPAREIWTALELADHAGSRTLAVTCAFRTDTLSPAGTSSLPGLTPERGNHWPALMALDPLSTRRLDGHTELPTDLLTRLRWPVVLSEQAKPRHAAAT